MTTTQEQNVPTLRFPEFSGAWKRNRFGEIVRSLRLGGNYTNVSERTECPLIKMGNLGRGNIVLDKLDYIKQGEFIDENDRIVEGNLFFNTRNTLDLVGKVAIWRGELDVAYYNSNLLKLTFEDNYFMNYQLNAPAGIRNLRRIATGTTSVAAIYTKDLKKVWLAMPSLPEQNKIASFFSSIDIKIDQLGKKKSLLERYKKGMMQKLFSQELRFKDEQRNDFPDWKEKRLGGIAKRITAKNSKFEHTRVLTNSAVHGVVDQRDYFDNDIANSANLDGYYIIDKGDFVYNPRISVHAPVGPIKRNNLGVGVMSPLYSIFRFNASNASFFEYYFQTVLWHQYMHSVANYGARHDRMAISTKDFMNIPLPHPCPDEQEKIADFLSVLDKKIKLIAIELNQVQTFKKGLLQQMFI